MGMSTDAVADHARGDVRLIDVTDNLTLAQAPVRYSEALEFQSPVFGQSMGALAYFDDRGLGGFESLMQNTEPTACEDLRDSISATFGSPDAEDLEGVEPQHQVTMFIWDQP